VLWLACEGYYSSPSYPSPLERDGSLNSLVSRLTRLQAVGQSGVWILVGARDFSVYQIIQVTKYSKLKLFRIVIRPILTCAAETWELKETVIQKLLVFERKILRRIFGPTKDHIWRAKTNEELDKLIKHKNIINYIKAQRLNWFGHVQDTGTVKKIFNWKPLTKRSQGRPKYRWEDNIKQDICQLKIKNWIACIQDQGKCKKVVEKAKTFN
jgi:hypothetical protein